MADVLVLVEHREGRVKKASLEAMSQARRLADSADGPGGGADARVVALAIGVSDEQSLALAGNCGSYGADEVLICDGPAFASYAPEAWRDAVLAALSESGASVLLASASATGLEVAARVAARLDVGTLTDVVELQFKAARLVGRRPVYAGKAFAQAELSSTPAIATLRPNVFALVESPRAAETGRFNVVPAVVRARVLRVEKPAEVEVDVSEAEAVVSAGRGLRGPEHLTMVRSLAAALGAGVGASRAIVDAGWIEHSHQVGQTGKTVSPRLYVALGISGAIQHLAGMSSSRVIVAINKDADAPIFKSATYGVVGDVFEIVPAFEAAIREFKARHA